MDVKLFQRLEVVSGEEIKNEDLYLLLISLIQKKQKLSDAALENLKSTFLKNEPIFHEQHRILMARKSTRHENTNLVI